MVFRPALYAWSASSEGVVACSIEVSNFCTELRDSPSFARNFVTAPPSAFSVSSLLSAVACSSAKTSPVRQFVAWIPSTYWLPRLAIEPWRTAVLSFAGRVPAQSPG